MKLPKTNAAGCVEKGEHPFTIGRIPHYYSQHKIIKMLNINLPYDPDIPNLDTWQRA